MKYVFVHKEDMSRRREFIIFSVLSAIGLGLPELARSAMERHIDFCCSRCLINRTFHAAGSR